MSAQNLQDKDSKVGGDIFFSTKKKYKQALCTSESFRRIVQDNMKGRQNREY